MEISDDDFLVVNAVALLNIQCALDILPEVNKAYLDSEEKSRSK